MYVPVLFGERDFLIPDEDVPFSMEQLKWWNKEEGLFFHPYILLNAYEYTRKKDGDRIRERLGIGRDVTVLGDSGGFQIWKFKANIPVLDIVKWQENNCDRAFIVDEVAEAFDTDEEFDHKLKKTVENCKILENNLSNSEIDVYRVLHGHTEKRIRQWYEAIEKFPFSAWSVGFHPSSDMWGQARMCMFLYHTGWRGKLHFLGASGRNVVPVMIYASKFFEDVVFDSTSYAMGIRSRTYDLPHDLFSRTVHLTFGDRKQCWGDLEELPCRCPVCSKIKTVENLLKSNSGICIALHNMWLTIESCHKMRALLKYEELYLKFVETNFKKDTRMALDFMKMCVEVGYNEAVREYSRFMRLTHSTQEGPSGNFFTMLAPDSNTKLSKGKIIESPEDKKKKSKKKKTLGPSIKKDKISRNILDLSGQMMSKLEEKSERPDCFGEFNPDVCCDSGFCGEKEYEECRESSGR